MKKGSSLGLGELGVNPMRVQIWPHDGGDPTLWTSGDRSCRDGPERRA